MQGLHAVCAALAVALMVLEPCYAKPPYSKMGQHKSEFGNSPFAPPAFYEDPAEYDFKDSKWMAWTPSPKQNQPIDKKVVNEPPNKVTQAKAAATSTQTPTPSLEKVPLEKTQKLNDPKFEDPCKKVFCKYGRVCRADRNDRGHCVCAGPDYCLGHSKQVCGTDGVVYPSHCELHRMACVKDTHIGIDHTGTKCAPKDKPIDPKKLYQPQTFDIHVRKEEQAVVVKPAPEVKVKDAKPTEVVTESQEELQKFPDYNFRAGQYDYAEEDQEVDPNSVVSNNNGINGQPEEVDQEEEPVKLDYSQVADLSAGPCEELEYEKLKNNLLQYHCARIGEMECTSDPAKKQFVANIMFNYYDLDSDQLLTQDEMTDIEHRDHLEKLSRFCHLLDFLTFNDGDGDDSISLSEFYRAYKIPTVALDESLKEFVSMVTSGNSVELKCDIQGAVEIMWLRNGATLDELITDDIQVFEDGSLYLKNIGLHHIGNYTCQDKYEDSVKQTHVLKVQMTPQVKVSPSTQFHTSGSRVTLKCHADGVPQPKILWEMNEAPLPTEPSEKQKHYLMLHNNSTLEIKKATYTKDTGAYKCIGTNSAGTAQDIATVFIENSNAPKYTEGGNLQEVFIVFHDKGFTVYEPQRCHLEHQVSASFSHFKYIPNSEGVVPRLCADEKCSWGSAVNVRNKFTYISQPELNRIIVIEIMSRSNPVEIIPTDKFPVKLHYVEHLDQVWVLCWNQEKDTGAKTVVVIRQASEDIPHHTVHTQPIGNRFDLIDDFFLPLNNDLKHEFDYGYVMHRDQQGLYKVDLRAMQYVKNIDLQPYSCVPKSVAFVPMGGQVIVHCVSARGAASKSTRLVLDYVTDKVLEHTALGGEPYLSPDARYLVTVETDGNTISVSKLKDDGKMEHIFDEYTNLHISDVTFFPAAHGHGYDFYASATNKNDVLYIELESGKVEMIEGVGPAMNPEEWPWTSHNRVIVSGGMFGNYLMTPSKDSVVVIDGVRRAVQCEWQHIQRGNVIIWVDPLHL